MMLPVERTLAFFERVELPQPLDDAAELVLGEIRSRLRYLCDVGLGYLTLDRQSRTLSGGEVQRINLTTALGTSLVNTLFVLDEPSVGLHPRDIGRIVDVLAKLRDAGNTLLVVEHDAQVMLAADRIIDMGPGPGRAGGDVVFNGSPASAHARRRIADGEVSARRAAVDRGAHLRGVAAHDRATRDSRRARAQPARRRRGDSAEPPRVRHGRQRLGQVDARAGRALQRRYSKLLGKPKDPPGAHSAARRLRDARRRRARRPGADRPHDALESGELRRRARADPQLFAAEPLARERRYTAGTFSFNTATGAVPRARGNGFEHVEMQFLSDVYLRCAECNGRRYRSEVLEVQLALGRARPKSIADVLDMTVAEALEYFAATTPCASACSRSSTSGSST